ncbi:MAG: hypothetical protein M5R40_26970 [Anaerolineae bacterium]|nr:hypothetical protein [Anaerolineae bacterium]
MKRQTISVAFLAVVLALAVGTSAGAQEEAPAILLIDGDLWSWLPPNGALRQLTTWGYNHEPVISPDGSRIAYNSAAEITVAAIEREGGIGGGATPSNIWLMERATGEAFRVIDQPPDASLFVSGVPDKGVSRSTPTWSPDGAMLAWTELTYPEGEHRLGVYDLASGQVRVMPLDIPEQYGVPTPLWVAWGGGGIAVRSITVEPATSAQMEAVLVYDADGALVSETDLQATGDEFPIEFMWIEDAGVDYVGVLYNTGRWALIDPAGAAMPMDGAPALYSVAQSPDGVSVTFRLSAEKDYEWSVVYADGRAEPLGVFYPWQIAISPAGEAILLTDHPSFGALSLWSGGRASPSTTNPRAWHAAQPGDRSRGASGARASRARRRAPASCPRGWRLVGRGGCSRRAQQPARPAHDREPACGPDSERRGVRRAGRAALRRRDGVVAGGLRGSGWLDGRGPGRRLLGRAAAIISLTNGRSVQ